MLTEVFIFWLISKSGKAILLLGDFSALFRTKIHYGFTI